MTKTFLSVVGAAALCGGSIFAYRLTMPARDDGALGKRVDALASDLDELKDGIGKLNRSLGAQGARLASTVGGFQTQPAKLETPEEEEARVEKEAASHEVKEREYHGKLDLAARGGSAPEARARIQKNLDALAAAKIEPAPFKVAAWDCTASLCRVELQRIGMPDPGRMSSALGHLTRGMAEATMRPFDNDRSVLYAAPPSHKLPSMDL